MTAPPASAGLGSNDAPTARSARGRGRPRGRGVRGQTRTRRRLPRTTLVTILQRASRASGRAEPASTVVEASTARTAIPARAAASRAFLITRPRARRFYCWPSCRPDRRLRFRLVDTGVAIGIAVGVAVSIYVLLAVLAYGGDLLFLL